MGRCNDDDARLPGKDTAMGHSRHDVPGAPPLGRLEVLTVVGVVGVLAVILGVAGVLRSGHTTTTEKVDYNQSGAFSYSAPAPMPSVYGPKGLVTGQPILVNVVGAVTTGFAYQFSSDAPAQIHGTAGLVAAVQTGQGFSREFTVAPSTPFTGTKVTVDGALPLNEITAYVASVTTALGNTNGPTTATVTLIPKVEVAGSLGGHPVTASYSPSLPLKLDATSLTASKDEPSAADSTTASDAFKPSEAGSMTYSVSKPATVNMLVSHPSTTIAMAVGFGVAGGCVLLALWISRPLLRDDTVGEPERIRALYASQLLPVRSLRIPEGPVAEVASISALADLAKRYETMIMHLCEAGGDTYLLWDDGMLYCYGDGAAARAIRAPRSREAVVRPAGVQSYGLTAVQEPNPLARDRRPTAEAAPAAGSPYQFDLPGSYPNGSRTP